MSKPASKEMYPGFSFFFQAGKKPDWYLESRHHLPAKEKSLVNIFEACEVLGWTGNRADCQLLPRGVQGRKTLSAIQRKYTQAKTRKCNKNKVMNG